MLAQEKEAKEKGIPCRLFPVLLDKTGGNQTCPGKPYKTWLAAEREQVIAESPRLILRCSARQKGIENLRDFVIQAKAGMTVY